MRKIGEIVENDQIIEFRANSRRRHSRKRPPREPYPKKALLFLAASFSFLVIVIFTLVNNTIHSTAGDMTESADSESEIEPSEASEESLTSETSPTGEDAIAAFYDFDEVYEETSVIIEFSFSEEESDNSSVLSEDLVDTEQIFITEEEILVRFEELREIFPEGKYWNHRGVTVEDGAETCYIITDTPCWHGKYGDVYCNRYDGATKELFPEYGYLTQCLAYASLVSDYIFGEDAPLTVFYDYDQLQIGDHIRLTSVMHSMTVTEKTDEYVTVMEVDADGVQCLITWDRQITRATLESYGSNIMYITRYETELE